MKWLPNLSLVTLTTISAFSISTSINFAYAEQPKLIVQITVDQLRGDLLSRYQQHFSEEGFGYLINEGIYYKEAHHQHAITETVVGHTTLATGAHPSAHGMVSNLWFDKQLQQPIYNVQDKAHPLLSANAAVDTKNEIDPTQKASKVEGRSPKNIMATTFSDELTASNNGQSKVFAVSVKDRGAITLAGHTGKAFWFSKSAGEFVSSDYYFDQYPQWVTNWNKQNPISQYADTQWALTKNKDQYIFGDNNPHDWKTKLPGYGVTFPHNFGPSDNPYFSTFLTVSPIGDEMTANFAKQIIIENKLGHRQVNSSKQNSNPVTDYLSISFSSTDYVGHIFGPSSLEAEENLLRLDRTLASLFEYIDNKVGLDNTLIVLSADHGAPEAPGYLTQFGIKAEHFDLSSLETNEEIQSLKSKWNIKGDLFANAWQPYINLDHDKLAKQKVSLALASNEVAQVLNSVAGIHRAYSFDDLLNGNVPKDEITQKVQNSFYPSRSGDIYLVFEPNVFVADFDGLNVASVHGSPWRYDTHVPIIFAGFGLKPQVINRPVATVDLAPTLSAIVNINAPSSAAGYPLKEVIK
ncbi:alkaline phosphatase family protein [Shewanella sp. KT0246]|uniref:alkaline phosphatase family protein n=1 Tax=Shewanella sp. KT0246 TaxID=2815912 RepID=UPI001BBAF66E|nr:alkaline phosphatase family protein [Shewanella sp. KT0246]GIU53039.1 alkaline phosphatase family protein [Shewanella sp. KT0246]